VAQTYLGLVPITVGRLGRRAVTVNGATATVVACQQRAPPTRPLDGGELRLGRARVPARGLSAASQLPSLVAHGLHGGRRSIAKWREERGKEMNGLGFTNRRLEGGF
jgi:hypothetical protein